MTEDAHPTDQRVGTRVRLRRKELGITQTSLANALGLSFQQVQKYEKGTNRISASRLVQIADFLQVTPAYLFEGVTAMVETDASTENVDLIEFIKTNDGYELAVLFPTLSLDQRRALLAVARAFRRNNEL